MKVSQYRRSVCLFSGCGVGVGPAMGVWQGTRGSDALSHEEGDGEPARAGIRPAGKGPTLAARWRGAAKERQGGHCLSLAGGNEGLSQEGTGLRLLSEAFLGYLPSLSLQFPPFTPAGHRCLPSPLKSKLGQECRFLNFSPKFSHHLSSEPGAGLGDEPRSI